MKSFTKNLFAGAAASVLVTALAPAAWAQVKGAPADKAVPKDEDQIVVTARYKKETVQDVPQAISAFDSRSLSNVAAHDLTDLAPSTPNTSIQPVATFSNSAAIYIRGIGAQGIESTEESPVGVSIDGVFITRPVATMLDTFDLARVEVLRGPQGTSFGKNSLAGGIAAYTKNPGQDFKLAAELTAGNYGRVDGRIAVDLPLVRDLAALRLVASREYYDGFFTNRVNGQKIGGQNRITARGTLLLTPGPDVTINLKGWWIRDRSSAPGGDTIPDHSKLLWLIFHFDEPNDGAFTIGRDFPTHHDTDQWGAIGNINVKMGSWNLTSITGYIKTDDFNDSDFDQSEIFFFPTFREQTHHQFSEELRLQGDYSNLGAIDHLNVTLGGYYLNQSFQMSQAFPTLPVLIVPSLKFGSQDFVTQGNIAKALFGQAIIGITPKLNLTLGVRESWESKNYFRDPVGTLLSPAYFTSRSVVLPLDQMLAIANTNYAAGLALKSSYSRNHATFKAGVDYKVDSNLMFYASYSQGYKGGGYGARSATLTTAGPTDDNTSEQWEAGMKGEFLGGDLRLNLTGFITNFKKLEFGVFFANPNVASGQETSQQNIGAATTKGIEIEAMARPIGNLRLTANIGYLDSRYTDFCADLDGPAFYTTAPTSSCGKVSLLPNGSYLVDQDYTYLKLVRAPKWQVQLAGEYAFDLGDAGTITPRVSMVYKSHYYSSILNEPSGLTGDFALVDGSIGWESADSRYRVMIWGKNLTDVTYTSALTPTAQFFIQHFYGAPRTFGVTFDASL
ncbi:MAG: TonB-dependent receptor [Sphingomonadales bacterium]|nr:TonB-dependent receptor [Sphingomonadales bacterium]MDE2569709.1 TonB-dependent receptor [Sphingomonadales bacterium]